MRTILGGAFIVTIALSLASLAYSQAAPPASQGQPAPNVTSPEPAETNSGTPLQPDTHPLGGAYLYTLGTAVEGHNYIQPEFSIGEMGTNNADYLAGVPNRWVFATLPEANVTLVHESRRNQFSLNYLGGGYIYNNSRYSQFDSAFHSLGLSDSLQFRRFSLTVGDFFSYLPSSSFGFGGLGGLGGIGSSLYSLPGSGGIGGVNPLFTPNQSILTSELGTYNNTALVQGEYALSARTSLTATGSYGTLQSGIRRSGFLNVNDVLGSGGIEHSLTPKDTIGGSYYYSAYHYVGLPESFAANSVDFNYGRKVTGRLALQVSGGPEFVSQRFGAASATQTLASGFGTVTYALRRDSFSASASRYASGGSGVLAGASTDLASGGWTRQWTRLFSSGLSVGYSRNTALGLAAASLHYDYWYTGVNLKKVLSPRLSVYLNYNYQRQSTNAGSCRTSFCAGGLAYQIFGVGLIFTPRPIGL